MKDIEKWQKKLAELNASLADLIKKYNSAKTDADKEKILEKMFNIWKEIDKATKELNKAIGKMQGQSELRGR